MPVSVLGWYNRYVRRDRTGVEDLGRRFPCIDGRNLAVGDQELIQHAQDRVLGLVRASIAHVIVLEGGLHNRNPRVLALLFAGDDVWVSLELRIFGAER